MFVFDLDGKGGKSLVLENGFCFFSMSFVLVKIYNDDKTEKT